MDASLYYNEVGALQHTRLPQCTLNEVHKWNALFCSNFQVSQLKLSQSKTSKTQSDYKQFVDFTII